MAAGLEVKPGELDAFKTEFNQAVAQELSKVDLSPVQHIDSVVEADVVTFDFLKQLKQLQPFGQNHPEPVWVMKNLSVSGSPRVVGSTHLKLELVSKGRKFEAIAFNYPLSQLPAGKLDVAFTLKENNWMGNKTLQLDVKDIHAADPG
ncbi:hypothetical protein P4E94_05070 [Pontiellaceae bacterium B12219]|nr:hypothetical protein [Pontiellaceae bacterium B12219]